MMQRLLEISPKTRALIRLISLLFFLPTCLAAADVSLTPDPITQLLQPMVNVNLAGAVVEVATKDKVLDLAAVGYADIAKGKPMAPNTEFWIASESKPMTAAAFMMLVDEKKVKVDDPVSKYLPEFKNMRVWATGPDGKPALVPADHPILIREVLSHTAGLSFSSPTETPTLDAGTLEQRVDSYAKMPLNTQPGTTFAYANAGLNIVGRIIEVVSGLPYERFMQDRLFTPLKMTDTTFWPNREQLARLATSYASNAQKTKLVPTIINQLKYPLDGPGRYPIPAGGLFSTASDEVKFCQMLLNHGELNGTRYLSEDSVRQMTMRQSGRTTSFPYGFGWMISPNGYYHTGAYGTYLLVEPNLGMISAYMVQQSGNYPNNPNDIPGLVNRVARQLILGKR